ncbi:hypothetical protein R69658_05827 [Paraburkholderia aspalathi]|jgi:hypothetical protein|uniref:Uncharacterized protein n=1 Tax=Paraburkholderia aspalathi TaxID=1324617 RepID=A0ABM8SMH9_9BURK|nr:hypothetical protein R69658_05827 [Paraburkholderia aspalathi]
MRHDKSSRSRRRVSPVSQSTDYFPALSMPSRRVGHTNLWAEGGTGKTLSVPELLMRAGGPRGPKR